MSVNETTGRKEVVESVLTAILTTLCTALVDWAVSEIRDARKDKKEKE